VNITVGIWWTVTLLYSLILVRRIPYHDPTKITSSNNNGNDNNSAMLSMMKIGERLLVEDHASPVGYKVPSLPDFEMDPTVLANATGISCCPIKMEIFLGVLLALCGGAVLIGLSFTTFDDEVQDTIAETFQLNTTTSSTRGHRW
jgi:hypothetical protein